MDALEIEQLSEHLLAWADDQLVLGHRLSEWCGHAPILEEDIAFANLALDEIGHASLWYAVLAELQNQDMDTYPDKLIYWREAEDFRNVQMVELPVGDWAFSILRQFLCDTIELAWLQSLQNSLEPQIRAAAAKIFLEELYHVRHSRAWIERLSQGTPESHTRLQNALDELWPYSYQWFSSISPGEAELVQAGYLPDAGLVQSAWSEQEIQFLVGCQLELPQTPHQEISRQEHTPYLKVMIADLQSVARLDSQARW